MATTSYFDEISEFVYDDQNTTMPLSCDESSGFGTFETNRFYQNSSAEDDHHLENRRSNPIEQSIQGKATSKTFKAIDQDEGFDYFNYDIGDPSRPSGYLKSSGNVLEGESSFVINTRGTESPPPPPPPPVGISYEKSLAIKSFSTDMVDSSHKFTDRSNTDIVPSLSTDKAINHSRSSSSPDVSKKAPFPFLKKNSRKEPSALNRVNSPSPKKLKQQTTPSSVYQDDHSSISNSKRELVDKSSSLLVTNNQQFDEHCEMENTLHQDIRANGNKQNIKDSRSTNIRQRNSSAAQFEWDVQGELAEFEKYERQVQQDDFRTAGTRDKGSSNNANYPTDIFLGDDDDSIGYKIHGNDNIDKTFQSLHQPGRSQLDDKHAKSTHSWGSVTQPTFSNTRFDNLKRGNLTESNVFAPKPFEDGHATENTNDFESQQGGSSSGTYHQLKLIRPVSTLKSTHGKQSSSTNAKSELVKKPDEKNIDKIQLVLDQKGKELEQQLQAYKDENANLKKLKKQQEQALAEILQKKEELNKFCEEERLKTIQWCEEQKQSIEKEKRTAAKQIKDMKMKAANGPTLSIRKEKAEIEGLQATIEKLKLDHDSMTKKSKVNENRLYGLIKEHSTHIDNLEKQLLVLEEHKILLLDFVSQSGLRLPKNIRQKLLNSNGEATQIGANLKSTGSVNMKQSSAVSRASKISGNRGYAEEVDVEVYPAYSNYHISDDQYTTSQRVQRLLRDDTVDSHNPNHQYLPGQMFNRPSSLDADGRAHISSKGNTNLQDPKNLSASWGRSSRYSESIDEENENEFADHNTVPIVSSMKLETPKQEFTASTDIKSKENNNRGEGTAKNRGVVGATCWNLPVEPVAGVASAPLETSSAKPSSASTPLNSERFEEVREDGSRVIKYRNGTIKEIDPSGKSLVIFTNGDTKQSDPLTGIVVYCYAQAKTTHTTYKDGTEIYEFPNGQVERHYVDGMKEVLFPDHTKKTIYSNGIQDTSFPDGVILREYADGRKEVIQDDPHGR